MRLAALLIVAACGGAAAPPPTPPSNTGEGTPPPRGVAMTPFGGPDAETYEAIGRGEASGGVQTALMLRTQPPYPQCAVALFVADRWYRSAEWPCGDQDSRSYSETIVDAVELGEDTVVFRFHELLVWQDMDNISGEGSERTPYTITCALGADVPTCTDRVAAQP